MLICPFKLSKLICEPIFLLAWRDQLNGRVTYRLQVIGDSRLTYLFFIDMLRISLSLRHGRGSWQCVRTLKHCALFPHPVGYNRVITWSHDDVTMPGMVAWTRMRRIARGFHCLRALSSLWVPTRSLSSASCTQPPQAGTLLRWMPPKVRGFLPLPYRI